MNCTICGNKIVLVPSAEERAKKDTTGKTAKYYESLFTTHWGCQTKANQESAKKLLEENNGRKNNTTFIRSL